MAWSVLILKNKYCFTQMSARQSRHDNYTKPQKHTQCYLRWKLFIWQKYLKILLPSYIIFMLILNDLHSASVLTDTNEAFFTNLSHYRLTYRRSSYSIKFFRLPIKNSDIIRVLPGPTNPDQLLEKIIINFHTGNVKRLRSLHNTINIR